MKDRASGKAPRFPHFPRLEVTNRQRKVHVDLPTISQCATLALEAATRVSAKRGGTLHTLAEVTVAIVSRRAMARVHAAFLQIPGPTDVITFPYGEIIVCAEVAASQAEAFGNSVLEELVTYVAHGFLHLSGHDDLSPRDAALMATAQEKIARHIRKSFLASGQEMA